MKGTLRDQSIVVLLSEVPCCMQCARDNTHGLELCSRIANGLLVNRESLGEVFVCNLLEAILIGDLTASNKEAQREICGAVDTGIKGRERIVHELVQSRRL